MAPPSWLRLYAATDDERYLNFAVTNFWRTTDYLYDTNENLFFRDGSFFNQTEANGKKIFWSRGNGWVLAGIVRMLQYLPANHPDRPRLEQLFKDMAKKILTLQQPDGLWRASLLDPEDYPTSETSGSALFTYGLAWGVNQGLLARADVEPAVRKAWLALTNCVNADGRLTHIQPAGDRPVQFSPDATSPYGGGVFLLAGSEIYRLAVWYSQIPLLVEVSNPANFRRDGETVEITSQMRPPDFFGYPDLRYFLRDHPQFAVVDGLTSRILDSQTYSSGTNSAPDKLLFQADFAPGEKKKFYILDATVFPALPPPIVKTFARYVPERHDDFAWESDRIAHRVFGKALETWPAEPLTSSGVDVWIKRTRSLIVNNMYRTGNYYDTNGVAQDDFKVGKTRGDGGLGVWQDGSLYVSANWRNWKLITTGPVRSEFELTYDAWDAGGRKISETKRISIDAGSNLSRVESTFNEIYAAYAGAVIDLKHPTGFVTNNAPLQIGVGLAERPGENETIWEDQPIDKSRIQIDPKWEIAQWQSSTAKGLFVQNKNEGWTTYWQPQDFAKGVTAVAIILPKGSIETFTTDITNLPPEKTAAPKNTLTEGQLAIRNLLTIAPAEIGRPFIYYFGAGWDKSGDFPNAAAWNNYVRQFAERRDQPLQVKLGMGNLK
jgi:hypothetical protein